MRKNMVLLAVLLIGVGIGILIKQPQTRYAFREEVATVVLKAIHGNDYLPPEATGDVFADMTDADYWGTKWAEQAYKEGLFVGCGELDGKPLFCPGGN